MMLEDIFMPIIINFLILNVFSSKEINVKYLLIKKVML